MRTRPTEFRFVFSFRFHRFGEAAVAAHRHTENAQNENELKWVKRTAIWLERANKFKFEVEYIYVCLLFRIGVRSNLSEKKSSEAHSHTQHTYGIPMPNKGNMSLLSVTPSVYISIPQTVTRDTQSINDLPISFARDENGQTIRSRLIKIRSACCDVYPRNSYQLVATAGFA